MILLEEHDGHGFCPYCWRHTVPKLTQDGNRMIEIFTFGSDPENIGAFMRASYAGGLSQAPTATSWAAQNHWHVKNSRKASRMWFLYWICESILLFVRPSWRRLVWSCRLCLFFVWSSVTSGVFRLRNTIRRKQERAWLFRKAIRLRETLALPWCSH